VQGAALVVLPGDRVGYTHVTSGSSVATSQGGGIFKAAGTVSLTSSAVAGNLPDNCEPTASIAGCTG
jgi:hypothetical protein